MDNAGRLIGLAYTSQGITVLAINNEKYRVCHLDYGSVADFRMFVQEQNEDPRIAIALSGSIRNINDMRSVGQGVVNTYVLFSDPKIMEQIEGIKVLDIDSNKNKKLVTPLELNQELQYVEGDTFIIPEKALGEPTHGITLLELIHAVTSEMKKAGKDIKDFELQASKFSVKLINKKTWVQAGRKQALNAGVDIKVIAELEKAVESDKANDELWRAYYDYIVNKVELEKIQNLYGIHKDDFSFVVATLGHQPGDSLIFTAVPGSTKKKKK